MTVIIDMGGASNQSGFCCGAISCTTLLIIYATIGIPPAGGKHSPHCPSILCIRLLYHAGGFQEYWAEVKGAEAPKTYFKPKAANIAPR